MKHPVTICYLYSPGLKDSHWSCPTCKKEETKLCTRHAACTSNCLFRATHATCNGDTIELLMEYPKEKQ